jgi:RimJ/RimL family protein N-acetyltransferase
LIGFGLPRATDRLLLRRFQQSDLERFQSYRRDPEVGRYQGWSATDDASAAAFLDAMAAAPIGIPGEWFQIAVADRGSDVLIGDIGLCLRDDSTRTAEVGFTIAATAQGKGLGTEAVSGVLSWLFDSEAVDLVEGITDARNAPSISLLARVGMRLLRVQQATCKGEPCTEYVYAIARTTWPSRDR